MSFICFNCASLQESRDWTALADAPRTRPTPRARPTDFVHSAAKRTGGFGQRGSKKALDGGHTQPMLQFRAGNPYEEDLCFLSIKKEF